MEKMFRVRIWVYATVFCAIFGLLHAAAVIAEDEKEAEEGEGILQ